VLVLVPTYTMVARLYIGAHHVTDVLTAFVAAVLWVAVCARLLLPAREEAASPYVASSPLARPRS
jgi:undecaprenyl-diphosphatase